MPSKTIFMHRVVDSQCSVNSIKNTVEKFSKKGSEVVDIGQKFSSTSKVNTYVYAKLKEGIELLLTTDMSESDSNMLIVSIIGSKEPTYVEEIKNDILSINCKN